MFLGARWSVHSLSWVLGSAFRQIFAFDVDPKRVATMNTLLTRAGVTGCQLAQQDFLTVDPRDLKYSRVTHILLDPSCSGSGNVLGSSCSPGAGLWACRPQVTAPVPQGW